jgi:hypothetical protein
MIKTIPFVNTATYVWAVSPFALNLKRIRGLYTGPTPILYLQLHKGTQTSVLDTALSPPANATVPIEEFLIYPNVNFDFDVSNDPVTDALAPVVLILSTTRGALTAANTETLIDVFVDAELGNDAYPLLWNGLLGAVAQIPVNYALLSNTNVASGAYVQIWTDDKANSKTVCEICIYQNSGTYVDVNGNSIAFLKLFSTLPVTGVTLPFLTLNVPNGKVTRFVFSSEIRGLIPGTQDAQGNLHYGFFLSVETAVGAYTAANVVNPYQYQIKDLVTGDV